MKTLINVSSNHLFGLKKLIEDLRDIYSSEIDKVYIYSIAIKSNFLEKREFYDTEETLLFFELSIIDTQKNGIEINLFLH